MLIRNCRALALVVLAVVLASGCTQQDHAQMNWARAALQRNNTLEIVATDMQAGTFTVRNKDSGELRVVRADEVMAAPPPAAAASGTIAPATVANTPPAAPPAAATVPRAAAPGESATPEPQSAPAPGTPPSSFAPQTASIESGSGRLLESGPGYTIKSADSAAIQPVARTRSATTSGIERRHEPIICQGARLVHIDNRNLVFDGDAVSAEDGCEIHITNSHIQASGVGILARAANVHVDNSTIEGEQGSIDASEGAQVYVTASQFRGLSRRLDSATVHDLGGNVWN
jgi:hypothetical protein